jgi:transcriptional antiterminator RfaH
MQHWFTLYTKPKMEYKVSEILTGRGIETYLPAMYLSREDRRKAVPPPFLPRYLFARLNPTSPDFISTRWTPGLIKMVGFGGKVAIVPDEVITLLKKRLTELERVGYHEEKFKHGERVRIKAGPLRDWEAIFDRSLSASGRVRVLLNFLGRLTVCKVELDWLEKVG